MAAPSTNEGWRQRSLAAVWHPCSQRHRSTGSP